MGGSDGNICRYPNSLIAYVYFVVPPRHKYLIKNNCLKKHGEGLVFSKLVDSALTKSKEYRVLNENQIINFEKKCLIRLPLNMMCFDNFKKLYCNFSQNCYKVA